MIELNRDRRRKFVKEAKKKGIPKEYIDAYLTMMNSNAASDEIKENEKVMVNVERVTSSKNYDSMSSGYKEFIQNCIGQIFTVHIEDNGLISLKESPEWLFWSGDLIRCVGDDA